MIYLWLFALGAIVGSFLNVVGLRWNSGVTLGGRSFCPVCKKKLVWWELIPVISFLGLGGRCSKCKTSISWQYPLIELWTGIFFVSLYLVSGFTTYYLLLTTIFSIYTVILIYDLRHKIIPDELVYAAIFLSLVFALLNLQTYKLIDFLAGPIVFSFFGLIWFLSRGRAMGFGDAKLGLSIGLLLGAARGFSAIIFSFWIGAFVTLAYMLVIRLFGGAKLITMKSEVPFAPFMILGAFAALVFQIDLLHVSEI